MSSRRADGDDFPDQGSVSVPRTDAESDPPSSEGYARGITPSIGGVKDTVGYVLCQDSSALLHVEGRNSMDRRAVGG